MLGVGIGIGVNRFRAGGGIPLASSALFWLDGTLDGDEFVDKSGNDRNFTITDKDFTAEYFPYKSAATVSAPVGDAALIAADINNFLYDSSGDPNAIPVVSFFQNIDYEDKLFCRHIAQVTDGNGVETTEPSVKDIVLYDAVLTGADLTTVNSYYEVPEEDASAIWCSPDGDDTTGSGTQSDPYLSIAKANTEAGVAGNVYAKTGDYDFGGTAVTMQANITGLGFVNLTNGPGSYFFNISQSVTLSRIYVNRTGSYLIFCNSGVTATVDKVYADDLDGLIVLNNSSANMTINNCVVNLDPTGSGTAVDIHTPTTKIDTCYFKCNGSSRDIDFDYSGVITNSLEIINNKINSETGTLVYIQHDIDSLIVKGNDIVKGGAVVPSTAIVIGEIELSYNDWNSGAIADLRNATITTLNVNHNTGEIDSVSPILQVIDAGDVDYNNNNLTVVGLGGLGTFIPTTAMNLDIYNNRFIGSELSDSVGLSIGDGVDADKITGGLYNNYIEQLNGSPSITHGPQIYDHAGFDCYYNFVKGVPLGLVYKGDNHDYAGAIMTYNVIVNGKLVIKGGENLTVLGNTVYNDGSVEVPGIEIITNGIGDAGGNIVKNNIFINENEAIALTGIITIGTGVGAQTIDYNIFFSGGILMGRNTGSDYATLALWQAGTGYDTNSDELSEVEKDAVFANLSEDDFSLASGSAAIGAGETLDAAYDDGLDASTDWGDDSTLPVVVTKQQTAPWDIGAYVS